MTVATTILFAICILSLHDAYWMRGSPILVGAVPIKSFFRPLTQSFSLFLSFVRPKKEKEEKLVTDGMIEDFQIQIRELQLLIFTLKTEKAQLREQLESLKRTSNILRKEKLLVQQSLQEKIDKLEETFNYEKQQLKDVLEKKIVDTVEYEKKVLQKHFELEKNSWFEQIQRTHKTEIDAKQKLIAELQAKEKTSTLTIEQLKEQCREKALQLKQAISEHQVKELDQAKSIEDLKKKLRIQTLESKPSTSKTPHNIPSHSVPSKNKPESTLPSHGKINKDAKTQKTSPISTKSTSEQIEGKVTYEAKSKIKRKKPNKKSSSPTSNSVVFETSSRIQSENPSINARSRVANARRDRR